MDPPQQLKPINIYLKIADEYQTRDGIIAYFCRLHALQEGMKINKTDKDCLNYLINLMDKLEKMKVHLKGNDVIGNDIVGQAYVESQALKLFVFADSEDRKSNFSKNVIKSFFTASILFDVMKIFGPLSDEIEQQKKYAKWKATYINDCQKKGIPPKPGPPSQDGSNLDEPNVPNYPEHLNSDASHIDPDVEHNKPNDLIGFNEGFTNAIKPSRSMDPPPFQQFNEPIIPIKRENMVVDRNSHANFKLSPDMAYLIDPVAFSNAERLCKFAHSALQYEDITTAISNLQECLQILTTMKRQ